MISNMKMGTVVKVKGGVVRFDIQLHLISQFE